MGVLWLHTVCGHCEYCLTGWETLCQVQQNTDYSESGSYFEYLLADPNYVGHLLDTLSFQEAVPLLCTGLTDCKGLKETKVKPGQWVVISDISSLGHLTVQ